MNREQAKQLHRELNALMDTFATEHGMKLVPHNASFDPSLGTFTLKVELASTDTASQVWAQNARWLRLPEDAIGKSFDFLGKHYQITALNPRARSKPVIAMEIRSGKLYKFPVSTVILRLPKEAPCAPSC